MASLTAIAKILVASLGVEGKEPTVLCVPAAVLTRRLTKQAARVLVPSLSFVFMFPLLLLPIVLVKVEIVL